jgi:hypothetical protein
MADCECLPKCVFFNDKMAEMPATAALMKKRYCEGDKSTCARWAVRAALGPTAVPADLFPNQMERAQSLIGENARRSSRVWRT